MPTETSGTVRQFARFIVTGGVSAVVDLGALSLTLSMGGGRRVAVSLGFGQGLVVNYALHRSFTFKSMQPVSSRQLAAFGAVVLFNFALTLGLVEGLVGAGLPVILAKVVCLPVVAASGFTLSRRFVFRTARAGPIGTQPNSPNLPGA